MKPNYVLKNMPLLAWLLTVSSVAAVILTIICMLLLVDYLVHIEPFDVVKSTMAISTCYFILNYYSILYATNMLNNSELYFIICTPQYRRITQNMQYN